MECEILSRLYGRLPGKVNRRPDAGSTKVTAEASAEKNAAWWAHKDLNLEPTDYESAALTVELWAREPNLAHSRTRLSFEEYGLDLDAWRVYEARIAVRCPCAPKSGGSHRLADLVQLRSTWTAVGRYPYIGCRLCTRRARCFLSCSCQLRQ